MKRTCILVVGMHRSGTSALAGVLNLLGVYLGSKLMEANFANEKGYFENNKLYKINEALLFECHSFWDDPFYHEKKLENIKNFNNLKITIKKEFEHSKIFAIKDPRLAVLFPIYKKVLKELDIDIKVILPYRHPIEVASSLNSRDKISIEKGMLLWGNHFLLAEKHTLDYARVFICFDELMTQTEDTIKLISKSLKINLDDKYLTNKRKIEDFLEPNLKHHNVSIDNLSYKVPVVIQKIFALRNEFNKKETIEKFSNLREEILSYQKLFYNPEIVNLLDVGERAQKNLKIRDKEFVKVKEALIKKERVLHIRNDELNKTKDYLKTKDKEITKIKEILTKKEQVLHLKDKKLSQIKEYLEAKDKELVKTTKILTKKKRILHLKDEELSQTKECLEAKDKLIEMLQEKIETHKDESVVFYENSRSILSKVFVYIKYLKSKQAIKKSGLFDIKYYLSAYPDVRQKSIEPVKHYLKNGAIEGKNPNAWFDTNFYIESNLDVKKAGINPFAHYILYGKDEGRKPTKKTKEEQNISQIKFNEVKENFVDYNAHKSLNTELKTIAFYLPQFHPFSENDEWWGKGFTDWINVTKAYPNFNGHYQPHLPIHSGFYDLRVPQVMIDQAKLAKNYGITGFNFYYYWFNGKILMHKPFQILLEHKEIDIDFCITWANENWTRRWDGQEKDILIAQNHCEEDSIKFIESLYKYFEDSRYIRIDNKPVLIIYRVDIIPNIKETVELWRRKVAEAGFDNIYLICSQAFGVRSPEKFGFDAAMEFPPHTAQSSNITNDVEITNNKFDGVIYDYNQVVSNACKSKEPEYKLFRTAMLSWDNTARKQDSSHIFHNFSLNKYKKWIRNISFNVLNNNKYQDNEKFIFINAWNEWAEGTHLEPDRKFGYGYLESTYEAIQNNQNNKKIIIVSHDAYKYGAQYLALNIAKTLKNYFNYTVTILLAQKTLMNIDNLVSEFCAIGEVLHLENLNVQDIRKVCSNLYSKGFKKAVANTSAVGEVIEALNLNKIKTVSLIHEMESVLKKNNFENSIKQISKNADMIVFPSIVVKNDFQKFGSLTNRRHIVNPQGLFRKNIYKYNKRVARKKLRYELNIDSSDKIILNIAYGNYRKGLDLFVELAEKVIVKNNKVHFVWVGSYDATLLKISKEKIKNKKILTNLHFIGFKSCIDHYYVGSDIFFLSSREDPFPSVVLDAMNVGLPVIAFKNAGGFADVISDNCGVLVEKENLTEVFSKINLLLSDTYLRNSICSNSCKRIENKFSFISYLFNILKFLGENMRKVSVIVPSYNYENYITDRINSILQQDYPIYEIIFLDDCSSDNSLKMATKLLQKKDIPFKIIKNKVNSGSVFQQWSKGLSMVNGDYIWIAESDDSSEKNFLSEVLKGFNNKDVILSYTQSKQIDENGKIISENYFEYTNDISTTKWEKNYVNNGIDELKTAMVVKNTIPNISSVVFKRTKINNAILDKLMTFKVAGDWYFYTYLLKQGKIAYNSKALNLHRRHKNSVTVSMENKVRHFQEIEKIQNEIKGIYEINSLTLDIMRKYKDEISTFLDVSKKNHVS